MDESRVLQRAGWAGAASVVLLVVGVALCASAGVELVAVTTRIAPRRPARDDESPLAPTLQRGDRRRAPRGAAR